MELILEFYQGLDTLNLIIFWGIIIVIILLLILSFILINKNKNLKRIVKNTTKEGLPIIKEEKTDSINLDIKKTELEQKENIQKDNTSDMEKIEIKHIETESNFIAEEHIKKYNENDFQTYNIKTTNEELKMDKENLDNKNIYTKEIKIPTKPYQRNVLREMSLSQTSPIGITRPINKAEKKLELAKDLEDSLTKKEEEQKEITRERNMMQNEELKKQLSKIDEINTRKTEIIHEEKKLEPKKTIQQKENSEMHERSYSQKNPYFTKFEELNKIEIPKIQNNIETMQENKIETNNEEKQNEYIPPQVKELLENTQLQAKERNIKSSSEIYLEEVSRKLAEAEIPDEVERTEYELEQEENAIISYKELMEKKDSIKTIDEEEAIISIEELMNKNLNKSSKQEEQLEESKLYNLSEEEENDNFLKELKQFRNDL